MTIKIEYYYKLNDKKEKVYYVNGKMIGVDGTAFEMKKWLVNTQKLSYSNASKEVEHIKIYKEPKKTKVSKKIKKVKEDENAV